MPQNISVDDEVYQELKRMAEPFIDSPNDVLRRVFHLGADPGKRDNPAEDDQDGALASDHEDETVASKGEWTWDRRGQPTFQFQIVNRTADRHFRAPILKALEEKGGQAPTGEVLERVEEIMKPLLKPIDYEPMQSGQIRWKSAANFERKHMALERVPLINPNSPRGIWELTDAGRQYLKEESLP